MQWRQRRSAEEHPALALAYVDVALAEGRGGEGFVRHITGVPRARVVKRSGQIVTARIPLEALEAVRMSSRSARLLAGYVWLCSSTHSCCESWCYLFRSATMEM